MTTLPPHIESIDWDDWNRDHIRKHGVSEAEVEEIPGPYAWYRTTYKNRIMATGQTSAGKFLTIVIGESPSQPFRWYVFSARPASRSERRQYVEWKEANT